MVYFGNSSYLVYKGFLATILCGKSCFNVTQDKTNQAEQAELKICNHKLIKCSENNQYTNLGFVHFWLSYSQILCKTIKK